MRKINFIKETLIVLASLIAVYILSLFVLFNFNDCNQNNSPSLNLEVLFYCVNKILDLTAIYIIISIFVLFFLKKISVLRNNINYIVIILCLLLIWLLISK
ncbi:hypothetical protein FB1_09760 [Flavobacterium branchiophilum NBRC 15030 = ATCC 35035]|nr:hypothetical protein FB1_09760 [Flavobacterium branchiophilum NBRC 15030 = ATCC 35035]